ncbi:UDP-N-acetyl-D-mannosamine dehydrogenase [Microbulbifer sp. JMSA008]|uniref:UDP-N-acetyl-D-mannosamine dehydrogenase n=1 Tax=unclassified Microbulbifer TaxID=2619833 RepID=UPI00403AA0D4
MKLETISVIGLGYIGLPTAAVIASRRKKVIGVDVNKEAVETINKGNIHIVEPELDIIVHAAVTEGYLQATTNPQPADAFMIAVPTPFTTGEQGKYPKANLDFIQTACKSLAPVLKPGNLVVLESTSPVGTTEKMSEWLADTRPDLTFPQTHGELSDIRIAYCPERVLPGHVIRELVENDRVIGGMTRKCSDFAKSLYQVFVEGECLVTTTRTAEMTKLTENSFRDVNIAFANELSMICNKLGINVWELISLSNRHPRVDILQPGAGVGGHCIAVDPWFIVDSCPGEAQLISKAREVNDHKPEWILDQVKESLKQICDETPGYTSRDITIACLGISFKPNIDDLRESPALNIATAISGLGCQVQVVEPNIDSLPNTLDDINVNLVPLEKALEKSDIVCVLVKHNEFSNKIRLIQSKNIVIDSVGLLG